MRRTGIRIATGALFVLCCFLVASIINDISASLLTPSPSLLTSPESLASTLAPSRADRQQILERNLFGSREEPAPLIAIEIEPEEELEETRLPLKLIGTVASVEVDVSRAAIADRSGTDHQVVRVGDYLENHPQVEVVAIEPRRVVLQNGAKREELALEDEEMTIAALNREAKTKRATREIRNNRGGPKPRAAPPPRPPSKPQAQKPVNRLRQLAEIAKKGTRGENAASDTKVVPKFDDQNAMIGVELSSIEEGSLFEKLGLKDGDLVSEVNGIAIDSPAAGQQVLEALTKNEKLSAVVNGESITVTAGELSKLRQ